MKKISRILVVEDETIIAEFLETILKKKGYGVDVLYSGDINFSAYLKNKQPDLVMLDINLNSDKTGIDLAKICSKNDIPFIYLTSYSDNKTLDRALIHEPIAYILKPFSEKDIDINLALAKSKISRGNSEKHLMLKDGYDLVRVNLADIKWLKADNIYTEIVTSEKKYLQRVSLTEFHKTLPQETFLRVHRSYVININEVSRLSSDCVLLGEEKIPIGRTKKAELQKIVSERR